MGAIGIVCEYNPFHRGHEYHISKSRGIVGGDAPVICVMTGDFVQRGEPAIFSKYARAEAACLCGADIVVELPLPWSLASAERFASGAVSLLAALGAEHISFGSEAGELQLLEDAAAALLDPDFNDEVKSELKRNPSISYPQARQIILQKKTGEWADVISMPNNILAIEYIKAIISQELPLKPVTVKRIGSAHDSDSVSEFRSAAEIRRIFSEGGNMDELLPEKACTVFRREMEKGRVIKRADALDLAILSRLRMFGEKYFDFLPDASDGAGRRLFNAVQNEPTLETVCTHAKTRRYTLSRIRRMCMCAALGLTPEMQLSLPTYARILAADQKGCDYLRSIRENSGVELISKPAAIKKLDRESNTVFTKTAAAHDLYVLGFPSEEQRKAGDDWRTGPKIV